MADTYAGGCLCGAIRYSATPPETLHYICHCTDCQRYGGAAYHAGIVVAAADLRVTGTPKVHTKIADSGRTIARHFCGACGGHLFTSPWPEATRYSIKAGTLDDPSLFVPRHEIWTRSMTAWAVRPEGAETFAEGFARPVAIGAVRDPDEDRF